jgi:hypothetical protein
MMTSRLATEDTDVRVTTYNGVEIRSIVIDFALPGSRPSPGSSAAACRLIHSPYCTVVR